MKAFWKGLKQMPIWTPQGIPVRYMLAICDWGGTFNVSVNFNQTGGRGLWDHLKEPGGDPKGFPTVILAKEAAENHARSLGWVGDVEGE